MNRIGTALAVMCLSLPVTSVAAALLQVSFFDAAGDQARDPSSSANQIDLLSMRLVFDSASGIYQVTFTTSADHPLFGPVSLNANMLNGDLPFVLDRFGNEPPPPAIFRDNFNDFVLDVPQVSMVLSGQNDHLPQWRLGDRVATDSGAFPQSFPNGVLTNGGYLTTIQGRPDSRVDLYDAFPERTTIAVVTAVPLPASLPLFASMFGVLLFGRKRWRPSLARFG